jgi:tRNA (guanine-N7-)-methyltransferase
VTEDAADRSVDERVARIPRVPPPYFPASVPWRDVFGDDRPLELEIGCGRPHFLFERAREVPAHGIVGIEWKARWIERAVARVDREGWKNVVPLHGNAWLLAGALFAPSTLSAVWLHFPDPWWKAKHKKRRVVNDAFTSLVASRLQIGGMWFVQTDVASLLEDMLEVLEACPLLENAAGPGRLSKKPCAASSHREKKCRAESVPVFRAVLRRRPDAR